MRPVFFIASTLALLLPLATSKIYYTRLISVAFN